MALARGDHRARSRCSSRRRALQPENLEAAAFVRRHFRDRCLRRRAVPEEEGFVKIFPALAEIKERYRRVFAPRPPAAGAAR